MNNSNKGARTCLISIDFPINQISNTHHQSFLTADDTSNDTPHKMWGTIEFKPSEYYYFQSSEFYSAFKYSPIRRGHHSQLRFSEVKKEKNLSIVRKGKYT